jgi:hypothetical protein
MAYQKLALLLVLLALLATAGCGHALVFLDTRSVIPENTTGPRADLMRRYAELADSVQITAGYYEQQVGINHGKLRAMSVLAIFTAGTAAAIVPAASHAQTPDTSRPGLAAMSISLSATSAIFALLPHAHQYILKEAGYARQARELRAAYAEVEAHCGPAVMSDPDAPVDRLGSCVDRMQVLAQEARTFPDESPCRPPLGKELKRLLESAERRGQP